MPVALQTLLDATNMHSTFVFSVIRVRTLSKACGSDETHDETRVSRMSLEVCTIGNSWLYQCHETAMSSA